MPWWTSFIGSRRADDGGRIHGGKRGKGKRRAASKRARIARRR